MRVPHVVTLRPELGSHLFGGDEVQAVVFGVGGGVRLHRTPGVGLQIGAAMHLGPVAITQDDDTESGEADEPMAGTAFDIQAQFKAVLGKRRFYAAPGVSLGYVHFSRAGEAITTDLPGGGVRVVEVPHSAPRVGIGTDLGVRVGAKEAVELGLDINVGTIFQAYAFQGLFFVGFNI